MRRLRICVLLICAAAIAIGASAGIHARGSAEDQNTIAFIATGSMAKISGEACIVGSHRTPPATRNGNQVVIENAEGVIVAVRDLGSFPLENGDTPSDVVGPCMVNFSIDVPKSPFYRVYVDDTLLTVVDANELPYDVNTTDPNAPQAPWIDFGE